MPLTKIKLTKQEFEELYEVSEGITGDTEDKVRIPTEEPMTSEQDTTPFSDFEIEADEQMAKDMNWDEEK